MGYIQSDTNFSQKNDLWYRAYLLWYSGPLGKFAPPTTRKWQKGDVHVLPKLLSRHVLRSRLIIVLTTKMSVLPTFGLIYSPIYSIGVRNYFKNFGNTAKSFTFHYKSSFAMVWGGWPCPHLVFCQIMFAKKCFIANKSSYYICIF